MTKGIFSWYPVFLFISFLILSPACKKYNSGKDIPAYIRIPSVMTSTTYSTQGSSSHRITDAWVYIDNNLIGCFELPAILPVLAHGEHQLSIRAGIKANGLTDYRFRYPFYSPSVSSVAFIPNEEIRVMPVFTYYSETIFAWIEDFENQGLFLVTAPKSQVPLGRTSDPGLVFEGKKSAEVILSGTDTVFECFTDGGNSPFTFAGANIYLEMNYTCTLPIVIGLYINFSSSTVQYPVMTLYATGAWKKIYIDLTEVIKTSGDALNFDIFIGVKRSVSDADAIVYIDNIKLIN